jgi:hypothetical protein
LSINLKHQIVFKKIIPPNYLNGMRKIHGEQNALENPYKVSKKERKKESLFIFFLQ